MRNLIKEISMRIFEKINRKRKKQLDARAAQRQEAIRINRERADRAYEQALSEQLGIDLEQQIFHPQQAMMVSSVSSFPTWQYVSTGDGGYDIQQVQNQIHETSQQIYRNQQAFGISRIFIDESDQLITYGQDKQKKTMRAKNLPEWW